MRGATMAFHRSCCPACQAAQLWLNGVHLLDTEPFPVPSPVVTLGASLHILL